MQDFAGRDKARAGRAERERCQVLRRAERRGLTARTLIEVN